MMGRNRNLLLCFGAALAAMCLSATDANAETREYVFYGEGATASDQFFQIPADKVRGHVPEGYTLATVTSPTGEQMAQLFVNANEFERGTFDGIKMGRTRILHLAIQIEPPPAPPGRTFRDGVNHFYELAVVTNSSKLAGVVHSRLGWLITRESEIDFLFEPAPAFGLGLLYGAAPMPLGFFSKAEFKAMAPLDAVVEPVFQGYFWYEGAKGLVISQLRSDQFVNIKGSPSLGTVCGEAGSWFSESIASECSNGAGMTWKSDRHVMSFEIYDAK